MPDFVVGDAGSWGKGLFAGRDLPAMYLVGEYTGLRSKEALTGYYMMNLEDGTCIDGSQGGNHTRYVNHAESNEANAEIKLMNSKVRITLIKSVRKGEQIVMDYGPDYDYAGCGIDTHEEKRFLLSCLTEEKLVIPADFRRMNRILYRIGDSNTLEEVVVPRLTCARHLDQLLESLCNSQTIKKVVMDGGRFPKNIEKQLELMVADRRFAIEEFSPRRSKTANGRTAAEK